MDETAWFRLIYLLLLAALIAPVALRLTRGRRLPFLAVWLAVLAALMFLYQTFGPF